MQRPAWALSFVRAHPYPQNLGSWVSGRPLHTSRGLRDLSSGSYVGCFQLCSAHEATVEPFSRDPLLSGGVSQVDVAVVEHQAWGSCF